MASPHSPALGHNKYIKNSLWVTDHFRTHNTLAWTQEKASGSPGKQIEKAIAIAFKFIQYYKSRAWAEMPDFHH